MTQPTRENPKRPHKKKVPPLRRRKPSERNSPTSASLATDTVLLREAKRIFASKGYECATVKDLAEAAGVNVSLVSYHFGGKEALYRRCLETFGIERVEASERILRPPTSHEELLLRLRLFAEDFFEITLRDPDTCKIVMRSLDNLDAIAAEIIGSVFIRVFNTFHDFLSSAQTAGIIDKDLDTEVSATLIFGSLVHLVRTQELARHLGRRTLDQPAFRTTVVEHWLNGITCGITRGISCGVRSNITGGTIRRQV